MKAPLSLAVTVPAIKGGLGVDRVAVDTDLEVEVTADGAGVASLADATDMLAGPDALVTVSRGGADQVSVEVTSSLPLAVDQQVVAVEHRVIPGAQHAAGRDGDQRSAASSDDVEPFVGAAARPRSAEFTDVAAPPVRRLDREDVRLELGGPVVDDRGDSRRSQGSEEQDETEEKKAAQWCSMTRSTMLYSFASSAVMK